MQPWKREWVWGRVSPLPTPHHASSLCWTVCRDSQKVPEAQGLTPLSLAPILYGQCFKIDSSPLSQLVADYVPSCLHSQWPHSQRPVDNVAHDQKYHAVLEGSRDTGTERGRETGREAAEGSSQPTPRYPGLSDTPRSHGEEESQRRKGMGSWAGTV